MPLCLTRKPGQTIHIGTDITIYVGLCEMGKCRLSISAPRDVTILRGELLDVSDGAAEDIVSRRHEMGGEGG